MFIVLLATLNRFFRAILLNLVVNPGIFGISATPNIVGSSVSSFSSVRCFSFNHFSLLLFSCNYEYFFDVLELFRQALCVAQRSRSIVVSLDACFFYVVFVARLLLDGCVRFRLLTQSCLLYILSTSCHYPSILLFGVR